jgi:hypothetical protein
MKKRLQKTFDAAAALIADVDPLTSHMVTEALLKRVIAPQRKKLSRPAYKKLVSAQPA